MKFIYLLCLTPQIDLMPMINKRGCECLNQSSDHNYENALFSADSATYLESDADEQVSR